MENHGTATVSMTVTINGVANKTFTSSGETDGDPRRLAEQLTFAVGQDARDWIGGLRQRQIQQQPEASQPEWLADWLPSTTQ